jgi:hypothetical protein
VLEAQGVEVAPAVLDSDASADIGQRQVVIEDLPVEREDGDRPGDEPAAQDQEPTETDRAQVMEPQPADRLTPLS